MLEFKKYFDKAGGLSLIKQYYRSGALWSSIVQFFLLGRSKKALELLRLTATLKTQRRLERKYSFVLENFKYNNALAHVESRKVWVFWWQGMEKSPLLIQRCYQSVKEMLSNWEIILITENNYKDYTNFPDYIIQKLGNGQITLTHFSDLLRLELLINYGGLWLDATVLCTSKEIPSSILNSDLFVYQIQKPGADGHSIIMSSWCMYAKTNQLLLMATRDLLYEYWGKNNKMDDYYLLHQFFSIVCNKYPEEVRKIPPFCNSLPHVLLLHFFDNYNEQYWNDLKKTTCFHKLSYKLDKEKMLEKGTYYDVIINNYRKNEEKR